MRVGDQFVVTIDGHQVCLATVESIEDDRATVLIPATRAVFGIASSLTDLEPEVDRVLSNDVETRPSGDVEVRSAPVRDEKPSGIRPEDMSNEGLRGVELDSSAID